MKGQDGRYSGAMILLEHVANQTAEGRFWAMVDRSGECWVWTGSRQRRPSGELSYGRFAPNGDQGPVWQAHRFSRLLADGRLPDEGKVLHHCDNPGCVRPEHLYVGTSADNNADMVSRGRIARQRGTSNPRARLTEAQVREVRRRRDEGPTPLAQEFGVRRQSISDILAGRTWGWLE